MAQTTRIGLIGPNKTIQLTVSATDDAWTENLDDTDTLSLFKVALGQTFHSIEAHYNVGGGICRIRNLHTNRVKMVEGMTMPKGVHVKPLDFGPIRIEDGDILETFVTVAGS